MGWGERRVGREGGKRGWGEIRLGRGWRERKGIVVLEEEGEEDGELERTKGEKGEEKKE